MYEEEEVNENILFLLLKSYIIVMAFYSMHIINKKKIKNEATLKLLLRTL